MGIRTYSELIRIPTFEERLEYLRLLGSVGYDTFGFDRIFNQMFYTGKEWQPIRNHIITRDNGCDLGMPGYEILGDPRKRRKKPIIIVHHMNPISLEDIQDSSEYLLNPEYLICCSLQTHNYIHYGRMNPVKEEYVERVMNDTCPWKKI